MKLSRGSGASFAPEAPSDLTRWGGRRDFATTDVAIGLGGPTF
ncbi:hypothetical protein N9M16_02715 [Candidatus Dependentiae bacterium]|nr:hypothetical protein [Candidatus Dependentiae bacterium]